MNFGSRATSLCQNVTQNMPKLTNTIIEAAIDGFESRKRKIDLQIAGLRSLLNGHPAESVGAEGTARPLKRKISAAARKRMAAAQKKRWAAVRGREVPAKGLAKPKHKLSAAGRAAIVAAMKKRWADKKAAAKK